MNPDRAFYAIMYRARDGRPVFAERTAADAASLSETVKDINEGQVSDVVVVLASNPSEGWSRDVSEDVARECAKVLCDNGQANIRADLRDFIESHCGLGTAIPAIAFEPADAA